MPYQPAAPILRVCLPDDTTISGVQQYDIHFKDDAHFKQAVSALYSSHLSPSPLKPSSRFSTKDPSAASSLSTSALADSSEQSESSGPPSPVVDPQLKKILQDRADTLLILEGKKTPNPNRDFGNAPFKPLFDLWAGSSEKPRRRPIVPDAQPSRTNPVFTWSAFHKVLLSQMCPEDQRAFPESTVEMVPTLLFLGKQGDGDVVRSRAPLAGESVKFFEALMVDVMVRGWTDVLWLGREGEQVPGEVQHESMQLAWGIGMI